MFEVWQSFSDDALTLCPQTHDGESTACGAPVKKVFSKVGISFKGEGFYKTDHAMKKPAESAADSSSSTTSSTDKSTDKSSTDKASTTSTSKSASGSDTD